jgi:predicted CoA-binding protein
MIGLPIAVVGASNNPERWGYQTTKSVRDFSQFHG